MDQQKIGSFLKELRKKKHATQEQLAEALGYPGGRCPVGKPGEAFRTWTF